MMMGTVSSSASSSSSLMSSNINMLDFTYNKPPPHVAPDQNSSECNSRISRSSVGVCNSNNKNKKGSRVQQHLKVRKEKLGDRITALHQLVSPFGKTDTASVLMEAIGYIGFLHAQIQALTSPYLHNTNPQQHSLTDQVQGVLETNCVFPEDPGQVLNNNEHGGLKRKGGPTSVHHEVEDSNNKDLFFFKTRGFCLLPISCIQHFGTPNAPDYCTSPFATGF
ncbi:hypothetical protein PIB30_049769 [Stylosanthes scabra]|uniref:BHLH domain-containing protein n=1 Tax=Stylosanthes scabra TaxID=79078 RepID=A0ABU6YG16_9FABA|nr:hypothetical protein [Stylosanthes scabra]